MTNIVNIEEELCTQNALFNVTNRLKFSLHDENLPRASFLLSSAKNCGLPLLINKLLASIDVKTIHQTQGRSSYRLAEQLLANFHRSTITIIPSTMDDPHEFVAHLIKVAQHIAAHTPQHELYSSAMDLIGALNAVQSAGTEDNTAILERNWKEFSFRFFKQKLNLLMKK